MSTQADDLWNTILSLAEGKRPPRKPQAYTKAAKRKTKRDALAAERRRLNLPDPAAVSAAAQHLESRWEHLELILLVHEWECSCCGNSGTTPNSVILLRSRSRRDPSLVWCRPLEDADLGTYASLPRRIEYRPRRVIPACPRCFDLCSLIAAARESNIPVQLSLPLEA